MDSMMEKAFNEISQRIDFLKRSNSRELHMRAFETAARIGVPEQYVWQALAWFATFGSMRLSTWSESLRREILFGEWPFPSFFNNREDCNYVRLRPVGS
jgi:hypothetical protein